MQKKTSLNRTHTLTTLLLNLCLFCRYPDGSVKLRNPHIELMDQDILYHLALGSGSHDLVEMFGDVKVSTQPNALSQLDSIYYSKF